MSSQYLQFQQLIANKFKYHFFLFTNLPMALLAGLKVEQLSTTSAAVSVKFKWLNKNPFRSIYFAVLSMAAELSTGIQAFGNIYKKNPTVSMLVAKMEGEFYKKALGKIVFTCNDGEAISQAIEQTLQTGEGITVVCTSNGKNENGELVAIFKFTWTFKRK